jgi:hypothetical protein
VRYFFFDFETFLIQPRLLAPPPVCMSYQWTESKKERGPRKLVHANPRFGDEMERVLLEALTDDSCTMVAHNAAFEAVVIMAWRNDWIPLLFEKLRKDLFTCTMLREKLIRIGRGDQSEGFGLDDCTEAWMLDFVPDKGFEGRSRYGRLWAKPLAQWTQPYIEYATGDLCVADLFFAQETAGPEYLVDQFNQMRAALSLSLTSAWGFPVDPEAAETLRQETEVLLEQYKVQLVRAGLVRVERGTGDKKGQTVFVRDKTAAEAHITRVRTERGLEVTRGLPTPKALAAAYKAAGLPVPGELKNPRLKRLQKKHIFEAAEAGVPEDQLIGNIKLDEDACVKAACPLMLAYTRFGQATTLMGKIRRLKLAGREEYERVQCWYNTVVNTGRTSSSQGEDPDVGEAWTSVGMQMQNLPRAGEEYEDEETGKKKNKAGARECFVAPGFVRWMQASGPSWSKLLRECAGSLALLPTECIVSVDFDAFEMRTWAQCCLNILGYSDLAEILNDLRRCPHIEMGTRLWDAGAHYVDAGDWQQQYAWGYGLKAAKDADSKKLIKDVRGNAKGPNFGLPGGMSWARLIDYCWLNYGVLLTPEQAQFAVQIWKEMYREAEAYLEHIKDTVGRKYGSRAQIMQMVSRRLRGDVGYTDASNGFFQALAADAAKAAGWALIVEAYENKNSPFYGARPLAFVHDEWLYAVRRDRLHAAAFRMRDVMIGAAQPYCPDVTLTAAPAAFYRWAKSAGDPCFNAAGELVPYEETQ